MSRSRDIGVGCHHDGGIIGRHNAVGPVGNVAVGIDSVGDARCCIPKTEFHRSFSLLAIDGQIEECLVVLVDGHVGGAEALVIFVEGSEDALLVSHDRLVHLHLGNHLHVALTVLVEGPVGCDCVFLDGQCKRVHQFLVVLQVEHIVVGADVDVLGNGDVEGDGLLWVECVHGALLNGHPVGHALDGVVTLSAAVVIDINREGVVFLLLCIDINGFLRFSPSHGVAVDES